MHKQLTDYGCGLYAIANACQLPPEFITDERLEQSKSGNTIGQLTLWLNEDGYRVFPHAMYYNQLPEDKLMPVAQYMYEVPGVEDEGVLVMPLMYFVKNKNQRPHIIAAHLDQSGNLTVLDSQREEPFVTSQHELNEHYTEVYGVFAICHVDDGGFAYFQ